MRRALLNIAIVACIAFGGVICPSHGVMQWVKPSTHSAHIEHDHSNSCSSSHKSDCAGIHTRQLHEHPLTCSHETPDPTCPQHQCFHTPSMYFTQARADTLPAIFVPDLTTITESPLTALKNQTYASSALDQSDQYLLKLHISLRTTILLI